jgi:lipoprotein NlpD
VKPPDVAAVPAPGAPVVGKIVSRGVESRALETPAPISKPLPPVAAVPAPAVKDVSSEFIWPKKGKILSNFAEPRSKGIDIDGKLGDPVLAAAPGRVTYTGNGIPGLGKLVVIKHDNGFITVYAHNRDIMVKEQQTVSRGQKIAELGSSDADRPKLHFQIRKGSAAVDPLRYLPAL